MALDAPTKPPALYLQVSLYFKKVTPRKILGRPLRGTMELSQVVMLVKAGQVEGGNSGLKEERETAFVK